MTVHVVEVDGGGSSVAMRGFSGRDQREIWQI